MDFFNIISGNEKSLNWSDWIQKLFILGDYNHGENAESSLVTL
jgi:hypothetical protein